MKYDLEIFKIWAPDDVIWSRWAKPVLFINKPMRKYKQLAIPEAGWIENADDRLMIIVDLPGKDSVTESLALARLGYRPVPVYNGVNVPSASAVVDYDETAAALYRGAIELKKMDIKPGALPVFMLDSRRMYGRGKYRGTFDNRWCVFPQDMPSAMFLCKNGIYKVIVRSEMIQGDLAHILRRYQDEGIRIYLCNGEELKEISVAVPSKYKSLSYRYKAVKKLARNKTTGFGKWIGGIFYKASKIVLITPYYSYGIWRDRSARRYFTLIRGRSIKWKLPYFDPLDWFNDNNIDI